MDTREMFAVASLVNPVHAALGKLSHCHLLFEYEGYFNVNLIGSIFSGDILVFLTGQEEIEATVKAIKDISKSLPQGVNCCFVIH